MFYPDELKWKVPTGTNLATTSLEELQKEATMETGQELYPEWCGLFGEQFPL